MNIRIKQLHPTATIPTRAKPGDSGLDLYANLPDGPVWLSPGERHKFDIGIAIELPPANPMSDVPGAPWVGWEGQVRGRSGLTSQGIISCGGLGTVDSGYRGPIGVTLSNQSFRSHRVNHGDRIAQLVICPVVYPEVELTEELSPTERGADGFGSTGV